MNTSLIIYTLILLSNPVNANIPGEVPISIASHTIPLNDRYGNTFVNDVFKDNILLTLNYLSGSVKGKADIVWSDIEKPYHYEFTLDPNEGFAFHDKILAQYKDGVVKTTNAHFNYTDGFKSDGYLTGDGVCHLASLIYWAAKDASLDAYAPANHDFAVIPDIPKEYGVSIFSLEASQNLYITNTKDYPVSFVFDYSNDNLTLTLEAK